MDAGDPADGEFGRCRIKRTAPAAPSDRDSSRSQPVYRRECEALCLSVVPSKPCENADVPCEILLQVQAESILQRAIAARIRNGRGDGRDLRTPERFAVAACIRVIPEVQRAYCARLISEGVAIFGLEDIATVSKQAAIEAQAIGDQRHGCIGRSKRPLSQMNLVYPAPGVAADVG